MSASKSELKSGPALDEHEKLASLRHNFATVAAPSTERTEDLAGAFPGPGPDEASADWAVIVNHGMGQQVHFETLESIALAIRNAEIRKCKTAGSIVTRVVKLTTIDGRPIEMVRAEMNVTGLDDKSQSVHVYESYWAPLTEGQVRLRDVLKFLAEGAFNGIAYLARNRTNFKRWAFGSVRSFPISVWWTFLKLILALVLFAPIAVASLLTVTQAVHFLSSTWRGASFVKLFVSYLTPYVFEFEICSAAFALGTVLLPKLYRTKFGATGTVAGGAFRFVTKASALSISFASVFALVVIEIRLLIKTVLALREGHIPKDVEIIGWQLIAIWLLAGAVALVSRWFLIQFLGDVAVYVSANKLSKFDQLRKAIVQTVFDVMGSVYSAKVSQSENATSIESGSFRYSKIIVVGHSLGSVISYDLLNQLLLEDGFQNNPPAGSRDIQKRTKLLLTFGSPLDKIAYLFRIKKSDDELRDAAAAAWQPLISDYKFRPEFWLNIFSWMDLFSAPLRFYDIPPSTNTTGGGRRILNVADQQAWVPLVAHTEYWTDDILGNALFNEIVRN